MNHHGQNQNLLNYHYSNPHGYLGGVRTHDPLIKSQLLCQLSYEAMFLTSFLLHIYYNIFFYKNQKRFFKTLFFDFNGALPTELLPHKWGRRWGSNPRHPALQASSNTYCCMCLYLFYIYIITYFFIKIKKDFYISLTNICKRE